MPDLVSLRLGKGSPLGFSLGLDLKIRILVIIRIDVWIRVVCDWIMKRQPGNILLSLSGLLTVDPSQRLKVREVVNHEWLRGSTCLPHTPLMTPGILGKGHKRTYVESALNVTYEAFNRAQKEGFTLMDVQQAPLAKRRKKNKTTSTDSRSTTSSDHSNSGGTSPLLNPRWHGETCSWWNPLAMETVNLNNIEYNCRYVWYTASEPKLSDVIDLQFYNFDKDSNIMSLKLHRES